ncbi:hypothetical protein DAT35_43195 [Vitiosangium sp. GDMCC 1.1324]|nr:hypothetical protein DAT35_43195 [Vitiosangium sp. GDMCC 1.1324]
MVLLLSGCQQQSARTEPGNEQESPAGSEQASGTQQPSTPEAPEGRQPPPAVEIPDQSWSARSADGNAEVRQTAYRDGKTPRCTSVATLSSPEDGPSVMWKWETCIATREQLKFVSPDGKRVLVIDPFPAALPGNWKDVEVATLYEHGVRMKGAKAGALVGAPVEVREPTPRIAWVKGQTGIEGEPPHYTSDGKAVEFETADGHAFRLGFEGEGFPASSEEKHAFAATEGMYRYKDEKGTEHFVGSRGEIPARYRARAVPVEAQVGVFTMKGPLAGEEPPPSESKPADSKPKPPSPPVAGKDGKDPGPKSTLEKPEVPTPAELLERARETAKKAEESQHNKEKALDEAQQNEKH